MIYLFDNKDEFTAQHLAKALAEVSSQRYQKAMSFHFEENRMQSVIAYLLLKRGLQEEYGITENPIFVLGEHDKPFIEGHPDIHFNLSHCKKGVVCAISHSPIGIDIEEITPYAPDVANYAFNTREIQEMESATNKDIAFTRLWTLKESVLKLTGEGLRDDLKTVLSPHNEYKFITRENRAKGYVYSICSYRADPEAPTTIFITLSTLFGGIRKDMPSDPGADNAQQDHYPPISRKKQGGKDRG